MSRSLQTTSDDGHKLHLVRWEHAGPDVLLVHGYAEHAGRYGHVAEALVAAGWRVTLVELRGHGQSDGVRGHTDRWHGYIEDVQAAVATLDGPFVMVGHSLGGLVACGALLEPIHPTCVGVALSNPYIHNKVEVSGLERGALRLAARLVPRLRFKSPLSPTAISRDPEVVRRYETDPLVFGTLTPGWVAEVEALQDHVKASTEKGTTPMLMLVGTGDVISDADTNQRIANEWGAPHEVEVYEGLYHELFNEPEQDTVIARLVAWMEPLKEQICGRE